MGVQPWGARTRTTMGPCRAGDCVVDGDGVGMPEFVTDDGVVVVEVDGVVQCDGRTTLPRLLRRPCMSVMVEDAWLGTSAGSATLIDDARDGRRSTSAARTCSWNRRKTSRNESRRQMSMAMVKST